MKINTITLQTYIEPKYLYIQIGKLSQVNTDLNVFINYSSFPGYGQFPGIWVKWYKYTELSQWTAKTCRNGSINNKLKFRAQVFENFN